MNLVFMGTPDFAVPSLQALLDSHHKVLAVVTAPDKPRGRGQSVSFTPVKALAVERSIPVLQPDKLSDPGFVAELTAYGADCFVVVAFRILPKAVFTIPPKGSFNLHASLLPKYRGAAPINWALMNGEHESGVTTFFLQERVDTGTILFQDRVPLTEEMPAGDLHDILSARGAGLVLRTVDAIENGTAESKSQDDSLATPAPKIFRDTCRIRWAASPQEVHNHIRGLSPHPSAWTTHNGVELKLYRTAVAGIETPSNPGEVLESGQRLIVACNGGAVEILELKQEGRRAMDAAAFLRGYRIQTGDILE